MTTGELPKRKLLHFKSLVKAAFASDELGAKVVAERAAEFETAHKTIRGANEQQGSGMRIPEVQKQSSVESVLKGII